MIFIKPDVPTYMLWWKFLGGLLVLVLLFIAKSTGTLYIPTRNGFMNYQETSSLMIYFFWGITIFSLWQGGYGLLDKYVLTDTE